MADQQTQPTILIAEDDAIMQELYIERFKKAGLTVLQAFDGMEAVEVLSQHPEINLVLLDLMLPKMSGYDVLVNIKHNKHTSTLPVIIVSALADIDDKARSLQLGATDYITKGEVLPGVIIEKIKQYVLSVSGPAHQ